MTDDRAIYTTIYQSPCGPMLIGEADGNLCLCDWVGTSRHKSTIYGVSRRLNAMVKSGITPALVSIIRSLDRYFAGGMLKTDVQMLPIGTKFQKSVWRSVMEIDYGTTATYSQVANACGHPTAIRAVSNAIASNPLTLFIPCHRIIGKNKSLTGYRGGIQIKQYLLNLEKDGKITDN